MKREKNIVKGFGLIVRELRQEKNISQQKLAELANLDRSYVSEVENGYKAPTIITVSKIADALDIRASEMFQLVEQRNDNSPGGSLNH